MTRIVGLDLSLRATGYADENGAIVVSTKLRGMERLASLRTILTRYPADLVILEDYAFSRADAHAHALGELGGVVKLALHEAGVPTVLVGPSALKKWLTGKGNANKLAMGMAAQRAGYDGPEDDNAVDAWALRQMGLYAVVGYDVRVAAGLSVPPTAYRDEAVAKVTWPPAAWPTLASEVAG